MITKRLLDLCISGIGLILLIPFLVIISILIKLDSPGPFSSAKSALVRALSSFAYSSSAQWRPMPKSVELR